MLTEEELKEYLEEIRHQVCNHCVERPPGAPPCGPQGKVCGVETSLPELIEAVHDEWSGAIEPYLANIQRRICTHCPIQGTSECPCPMRYLAVLVVQAVETVDQRHMVALKTSQDWPVTA